MHLITASILLVATLSVAKAQDGAPQAGYILGASSTEFGVSSHMLYVTYPGVQDEKASFVIRFKEHKEGDENGDDDDDDDSAYTDIHSYNLTTPELAKKPFTYFFALKDTKKGKYTVKFCNADGFTCSKPSSPPTIIDDGQGKLDCREHDEDVKEIPIPSITKYAEDDELTKYKEERKNSIAAKEGIEKTTKFIEKAGEKGFMYFLIKYDLSAFKQFFEVSSEKDADKYCRRKYTFIVVTQVIDKTTNQVLERARFTPRPLTNEDHIKTYITGPTPKEVPIELKVDVSKEMAQRSDLKIWHSVCISAKDMVSTRKGLAVKCSDPFENVWTAITDE